MMDVKNVLIAGVGGQGTIFAGKVLGTMLSETGYHVKISEIHGMSQRGGSVVTHLRFGEYVYAPVIEKGEADILIAMEELEALRYSSYLKEDGIIIMCDVKAEPIEITEGKREYPKNIKNILAKIYNVYYMKNMSLHDRVLNVRMSGAAAYILGFSKEAGFKAIDENSVQLMIEKNKAAFLEGYDFAAEIYKNQKVQKGRLESYYA